MIEILPIIEFFKKPILEYSVEFKKEIQQLLNNEVKDYLQSTVEKFGKIKTFLFRHERIEFYKVYYPIKLRLSGRVTSTDSIKELFKESNYSAIIGYAGSGKSMLMKHLFLNSLTNRQAIPIIIELRNLNSFTGTINEYIIKLLLDIHLGKSEKILERMLKSGSFIFLLDGYDEIHKEVKGNITNQITQFIDTYNRNKIIITSRPGADIELLPRFNNYYIKPLTIEDTKKFIEQQLRIRWNEDSEILLDNITKVVSADKYEGIHKYLKSPLLLSMFILTFEVKPEIPTRRSDFYFNVFNVLCIEHNALSKPGFHHNKTSGLSNNDIEVILEIFSFTTFSKGTYSFDYSTLKNELKKISEKKYKNLSFDTDAIIQDLTVAIPILIKEGLEFKYIHRSMQEFFAAVFIKNLDTNYKKRVYQSSLSELSLNSTDSFHHFWSLCLEVDKNSFIEFFILPNLENFIAKIDAKDDKSKIQSFLLLSQLAVNIEFLKEENIEDSGEDFGVAANIKTGSIVKSSWSSEFEFLKKILGFLDLFKIRNILEKIETEKLDEYCAPEWIEKLYNHERSEDLLDGIAVQIDNAEESELSSLKSDQEFYDKYNLNRTNLVEYYIDFIKRYGYFSDSTIFIQPLNFSKDVYSYSNSELSDFNNQILDLLDNVNDKIQELKAELKRNTDFNSGLIDDLLTNL
jgi:predicted NACHT family NTPase